MKIYEIYPGSLDIYKSLYPINDDGSINDDGYRLIKHFMGIREYAKAPKSYQPIPVKLERGNKQGDFPGLSTAIIFNERALSVLKPSIEKSVEFLPLDCSSGKFFMVKVTNVVDCLDYSRAKVRRFPSCKERVMDILSYAFNTEKLEETIIFRLPEHCSRVFVKQEFKDLVENNNLEGLIFTEIYSE